MRKFKLNGKDRLLLAFSILLLFAASTPANSAYAWGPNTHVWIVEQALEQAGDTYVTRVITENIDAFYAGLMFVDCTVFYYYTDWESYQSTHSWSFYEKLRDAAVSEGELAFTYGVACHLLQDSISHNYFVPRKIESSGIQNALVHAPVEAVVDSYRVMPQTAGSMLFIDDYLPLVNRVLDEDFTGEAHLLRDILAGGSFYGSAFTPSKEQGWAWGLYRAFFNGIKIFSSEHTPPELEMAVQYTVNFFKSEQVPPLDPTGAPSLRAADESSQLFTWILRIAAGSWLALLVWRRLKGER